MMNNNEFDIPKKFKSLSENLVWMSESDYPFDVFIWSNQELKEFNTQNLLQKTNHSLEAPVKVLQIDNFFHTATTEKDWYDDEKRKTVKRYKTLLENLKQNLDNIQVYKIGEVEIDVYIIGQLKSGDWLGLSTKAVET
ncbi:MAG: nuclease A inhibitor family protein [Nostocales cyanobacterium 94392]|nr:nuclease A inhibitor family protein [Nostocales cyanobacterium 94392]